MMATADLVAETSGKVFSAPTRHNSPENCLDANEFDSEIHNVLSSELLKISNYLTPGALNFIKPEINLLLNLLIFNYSVISKNATFGQELLNLKYKEPLSKRHAVIFTLLNYVLPYFKDKFEDNSSRIENSALKKAFSNIELFVKSCNFLNLIIFIREGRYPTVVDRLLRLTYSPVNKLNHNIGYNYLTRELLWHGFMELIMYILPLINFKSIKRKLRKSFGHTTNQIKYEKYIVLNTETKCVVCDDFPNLPCQISEYCHHVACYYCLKSNILADDKFICPVCGESNTANDHLKYLQG